MVRAILAGRKTQARRIINPKHGGLIVGVGGPGIAMEQISDSEFSTVISPYGGSGDRLWVRETWQGPLMDADTMETEYRRSPDDFHNPKYCVYAADGDLRPEFMTLDDELVCRWRPSTNMPRWASRISLKVSGVRVERLQDISEADALAEGIESLTGDNTIYHWDFPKPHPNHAVSGYKSARSAYHELWCEINGRDSWDANPWVWAIDFERIDHAA